MDVYKDKRSTKKIITLIHSILGIQLHTIKYLLYLFETQHQSLDKYYIFIYLFKNYVIIYLVVSLMTAIVNNARQRPGDQLYGS